jgi:hypothetical protein
MKKCFLLNYKKYEAFKKQNTLELNKSSQDSEMKLIQ